MAYARADPPRAAPASVGAGLGHQHDAINFYHRHFGISRAVLPRCCRWPRSSSSSPHPVEIEVFGFGGLCVMVEGRCALSAYATGESPNCQGACSPGKHVRWEQTPKGMETRLNGILIDRFADGERAGYPPCAKGRFDVNGETYYAIEEPTSLNTWNCCPSWAHRRLGDQDRRPPAQPRLRGPGHPGVARRHRPAAAGRRPSASNRPGWPNSTKVSEGQSHWALTA